MDGDNADKGRDGRWLSYADLAAMRGIDKPSAMKLALRHQWRRRKDNCGWMQVYVPGEWLSAITPRDDKLPNLFRAMSSMDEKLAKLTDEILQKLVALRSQVQQLGADVTTERNRAAMAEAALVLEQKARKRAETARDAAEARVRELEVRQVRSLSVRIQAAIQALRR